MGIGPTTTLIDPSLASLFGLSATTIQSQSIASSVGGLSASGSTIIAGLTLTRSAFNFVFDASLFSNPSPNTVLFNALGLSIILNEQIFSGDGINSKGITTNAIDVSFNGFKSRKRPEIREHHSRANPSGGYCEPRGGAGTVNVGDVADRLWRYRFFHA